MRAPKKTPRRSEEIHEQGEATLREAGHPGADPDQLRESIERDRQERPERTR